MASCHPVRGYPGFPGGPDGRSAWRMRRPRQSAASGALVWLRATPVTSRTCCAMPSRAVCRLVSALSSCAPATTMRAAFTSAISSNRRLPNPSHLILLIKDAEVIAKAVGALTKAGCFGGDARVLTHAFECRLPRTLGAESHCRRRTVCQPGWMPVTSARTRGRCGPAHLGGGRCGTAVAGFTRGLRPLS